MSLKTSLPFSAPNFPAYSGEDYKNAIFNSIKNSQKLQKELGEDSNPPTFENTIIPLEKIIKTMKSSEEPFALAVFDSNSMIQEVEDVISDPVSRFYNSLYQDSKIWKRIQILLEDKNQSFNKIPEDVWLLEQYRLKFLNAGASLSDDKKKELQNLYSEIAQESLLFSKNVLESTQKPFVVKNKELLKGIPENTLKAAYKLGSEIDSSTNSWAFLLNMPNTRHLLQEGENANFREKVWQSFYNRGSTEDFNNYPIMKSILKKRARIASIMGFKNWAEFTLNSMMAETPENALDLMTSVWVGIKSNFENQSIRLQEEMSKISSAKMKPSDWFFYAQKVRLADYNFSEHEMNNYLPLNQVKKGLFDIVNKLFDLKISPVDLPTFAENVDSYEVYRDKKDGKEHVGILYLDYFQRPTKRGGAWMDCGRSQNRLEDNVTPIVGNALNIAIPENGKEAFISMENVVTMFHELGHGLHGLLSSVKYPSQGGLNVPTDFVELPSQILENWALEPSILKSFAINKNGDVIPDALIASWQNAKVFDGIFDRSEYLLSAFQDLRLHMLNEKEVDNLDFNLFEKNLNQELGCPDLLKPRFNLSHFNHIFGWDYSARYYAYLWSAVLDADAFSVFKEKGFFDKESAKSLEQEIYSKGHSRPVGESFHLFMGRSPSTQSLLEREGVTPPSKKVIKL